MVTVPPWLLQLGVLLALLVSGLLVRRMDHTYDWDRRRRSRLLLGLPWGTFVSVGIVLSVYLFVQSGWDHWHNPVVVAFRSYSYLYPLGVALSGFAHQNAGHLLGNLFGTLVLGSLAEYAWGHFPEGRGTTTFASRLSNPYVRAFVVFPAAVVGVGLLTGLFAAGPVAGFSGVVYAFGGFALVRFPLGTIVALVAENAVQLGYQTLQNPVVSREAGPRFVEPWWAGISLQGHLLGVLIGVLLAAVIFRRRGHRPGATRLWAGIVLYGVAENLWIVWWYGDNNAYVLYRILGVWLVVVLGLLVAGAVSASDREFPAWVTTRRVAGALLGLVAIGWVAWISVGTSFGVSVLTTPVGDISVVNAAFLVVAVILAVVVVLVDDDPLVEGVSQREVATVLLALGLVFTAGIAIPVSLATVDDAESPGDVSLDVRDYTITYAENVTNEMVSVVDLSLFGETTNVRTSGVIVVNEDRHIWTTVASKSRLSFTGTVRAVVGGVGWRETAFARRRGWSATGGPSAYAVWLTPSTVDWQLAYRSDPALAAHVLAGYRVGIRPTTAEDSRPGWNQFAIDLLRVQNESVTRVASDPIPDRGNETTLGNITFVRRGDRLFATYDGTEVRVASRETYN